MSGLNSLQISKLTQRVSDLEDKVFKTGKKILTTKSQQMLLLHHLGILEKMNELNLSNKKKAVLLGALTNSDIDNIEKDLGKILLPDSPLKLPANYKFLVNILNKVGLKQHAKEADLILDEIYKSEK